MSRPRMDQAQCACIAAVVAAAMLTASCSDRAPAPAPPPASGPAPVAASPATVTAPAPAAAARPIHFTDITGDSGIDFTTTCGATPSREILEVNGNGLALFDFDHDGDLDLFITNGATLASPERGPGSRLFRNDGGMRFTDVTADAKIDVHRWAMGAAVGDIDGDGWEDLFIACYGPDILLRNNGDGTFRDVSTSAGIAGEDRWGTSAAFGDLDNDGDLDLYVANYLEFDAANPPPRALYKGIQVMAGPHGLKPQHDFLYRNNGDGTFRDATVDAGAMPSQPAFGLNVVILDFDNDGWQDIYVANDSMPGFLFRNKGSEAEGIGASRHQGIEAEGVGAEGSEATRHQGIERPAGSASSRPSLDALTPSASMPQFEEIGVISGIASNIDGGNQAAMGIAIADVDDNGFADKFITVFSSDTNTLHLNVDGRLFEDRSTSYGLGMISRPYLGWSCGFFDFDLDGDEDLLMFNGHVYPEATMQTMDSEYQQTPLLFTREGKKFKRVEASEAGAWLDERHRDRSAAFGDLDNDGDVDVVVNELNGPIRVLRNDALGASAPANGLRWLQVALRDGGGNPHGIGARIELKIGDAIQRRWLVSGGGFQSSSPPIASFGIPADSQGQPRLIVQWPDGSRQEIDDVQMNQRLIVPRK